MVLRLLDLMAFLSTRRFPVSGDTLLSSLPGYRDRWVDGTELDRKSVRRVFERDKKELRKLGVPLQMEIRDGDEAYYSLRDRDFYLPVVRLLEETDTGGLRSEPSVGFLPGDLRVILKGLRQVAELPGFPLRLEARAALRKLTFDLVDGIADDPHRIVHLPPFDPHEVRGKLEMITTALAERRPLGFDYYAIGADRRERRTVHPRGLLYQGSRWYTVAWDPSRGGERLFRVDRMTEVELEHASGGGPVFEIPADYSLEHLRRREAWELGQAAGEEVDVLFRPPLSLLAERNRWGRPVGSLGGDGVDRPTTAVEETHGQVRGTGDGPGAIRRFHVRSSGPFLRWVLSHGGRARIVAPQDLAQEAESMRRRILDLHR